MRRLRLAAIALVPLLAAGLVRDAAIRQQQREWFVDYVLALRG